MNENPEINAMFYLSITEKDWINVAITGIIFPSIIEKERIYGCNFWLSIIENLSIKKNERKFRCHHRYHKKRMNVWLPYFAFQSEKILECIAAIIAIIFLSIMEQGRMYFCHHCHLCHILPFNQRKWQNVLPPSLLLFFFQSWNKKECIGATTTISVIFAFQS